MPDCDGSLGSTAQNPWTNADGYEAYVGQWSRLIARRFVDWLAPSQGLAWLDVGSGNGALSEVVAQQASPRLVMSLDRTVDYLRFARDRAHPTVLVNADGLRLPLRRSVFERVVSGLFLNFVDVGAAIAEQRLVLARGGVIAAYVWNYSGGYQMIRWFWDAALRIDPHAATWDPANRFARCNPQMLTRLLRDNGADRVAVTLLRDTAGFRSFDEYWQALMMRQGSMAGYLDTVGDAQLTAIRSELRQSMRLEADGSVTAALEAFAVCGRF